MKWVCETSSVFFQRHCVFRPVNTLFVKKKTRHHQKNTSKWYFQKKIQFTDHSLVLWALHPQSFSVVSIFFHPNFHLALPTYTRNSAVCNNFSACDAVGEDDVEYWFCGPRTRMKRKKNCRLIFHAFEKVIITICFSFSFGL